MIKPIVLEFIKFVIKELNVKTSFKVHLSNDRKGFSTYAYYDKEDSKIAVCIKNRALADVLRSVAHEIQHHLDNENNKITGNEPKIGQIDKNGNIIADDLENRANSISGILVRKFGKDVRPDIYDL